MVNPGSFKGSRKVFLDEQAQLYTQAVAESHIADTVADIQRRYFKRYPISLPHHEEPSEEWLSQVNDDASDVEEKEPSEETMSPEEFAVALAAYKEKAKLIQYRKDQIRRRLHYQYQKEKAATTKPEVKDTDPMTILMSKLTDTSLKKPRLRTGYNVWGPQNRSLVDPIFEERVKSQNISYKQHAALRSQIYKECFEKLHEDERQIWEDRAKAEHQAAIRTLESQLTRDPSTDPDDRQRAIYGIPSFVQPILDLLAAHTGWKITLIAGGPEPADQGRLNVISVHSGETKGPIKMNFGKSERRAYKDYVIPIFGNFLKKCYTIEECRGCAISQGFGSLAHNTLNQDGSKYTLDSADDNNDVKIIGLSKARSVSAETQAKKSLPIPMEPLIIHDTPKSRQEPNANTESNNAGSETTTLPSTSVINNQSVPSERPITTPSPPPPPTALGTAVNTRENSAPLSPPISRQASPHNESTQCRPTAPQTHILGTSVAQKRANPDSDGEVAEGPRSPKKMKHIASGTAETESLLANHGSPPLADTQPSQPAVVPYHSTSMHVAYVSTPSNAPKWFNDALELFQSIPLSAEWQKLLEAWSRYQNAASAYDSKDVFDSNGRPACMATWIKCARSSKFKPNITNLAAFQRQFMVWWSNLQPDWRIGESRSLRQSQGDLQQLNKPGKNGFYTVVAALWFWGCVAKGRRGSGGQDAWKCAVDDVAWVMKAMFA